MVKFLRVHRVKWSSLIIESFVSQAEKLPLLSAHVSSQPSPPGLLGTLLHYWATYTTVCRVYAVFLCVVRSASVRMDVSYCETTKPGWHWSASCEQSGLNRICVTSPSLPSAASATGDITLQHEAFSGTTAGAGRKQEVIVTVEDDPHVPVSVHMLWC